MDYYKILEIDKTATQDQIKKAYRRLARRYHPDMNPNDKSAEHKFKEVNEAHEVLSNPETRAKYDQFGKNWQQGEEYEKSNRNRYERDFASSFGGFTDTNFEGAEMFSDLFKDMFGGGEAPKNDTKNDKQTFYGSAYGKFKGQDIFAEISLSLREVAITQPKTFSVNGKNIRINVPAGVADGQQIRLKGYGNAGYNGGPNGDLYITFNIQPDPHFERIGNDLKTKIQIDLYTAVLGGQVLVDTLNGKVKMTIPPESQNGATVRLKGKGFPIYRKDGEFGDLLITYDVQIPKNLTEKHKELFRELKNL